MEATKQESGWRDLALVFLAPAVLGALVVVVIFVAAHPKHVRAAWFMAKYLRADASKPFTLNLEIDGPELSWACRTGYRLTGDRKKQERIASLMSLMGDSEGLRALVARVGVDTPAEASLVDVMCWKFGDRRRWDWWAKERLAVPAGAEELWRNDDVASLLADVRVPAEGEWPGIRKPVLRYREAGYDCEVTAEFSIYRWRDAGPCVTSPAELYLEVRRPGPPGKSKTFENDYNYGRRGGLFRTIPLAEAQAGRPAH